MKLSIPKTSFLLAASGGLASAQRDKQEHYLVGLLHYPNSEVPEIFQNHTSGTYITPNDDPSFPEVPFDYIPLVGFSDMEPYYDGNGTKVLGEFYCLPDNGYGSSDNSADYALNIHHLRIQKPFTYRHGESTFPPYTPVESLGASLIRDPHGYVKWENGADIQVEYSIPDETWEDYRELRVLTGRDFDVEGMAAINQECAVLGEEFMPALFMVNPETGVVLSPFVRTPDIDADGNLVPGAFLSTRSDKVHCSIESLEANECSIVDSSVVDESDYRRHDKTGGFEGMSLLPDGSVAAFLEKNTGDTTLTDEPGVRVYRVRPGDCSPGSEPSFEAFLGFYPFVVGAKSIADVSAIPGTSRYVAVIERNDYPNGNLVPGDRYPANNLCIVDLEETDENMVFSNKKCVLNYHNIDDPWDVDSNGIFKHALTQWTTEALIVVDDHCIVAGTDTNYPWTNQFELRVEETPFWQEVTDTRFMVVCFVEPIFSTEYSFLQEFSEATPSSSASTEAADPGVVESGEHSEVSTPRASSSAQASGADPTMAAVPSSSSSGGGVGSGVLRSGASAALIGFATLWMVA